MKLVEKNPVIRFYDSYEFIEHETDLPLRLLFHTTPEKGIQIHWHEDLEILMVLQGGFQILIDNRWISLTRGDFIVVNCYQLHEIIQEESSIFLTLQIDPAYAERFDPQFRQKVFRCLSTEIRGSKRVYVEWIQSVLAHIVLEKATARSGHKFCLEACINQILLVLEREFHYTISTDAHENAMQNSIFHHRLKEVLDYINEHYQQKISLQGIAKTLGLNPSYLSRYLAKYMGISFQKYINVYRLQKSLAILVCDGTTITETAMRSGFADVRTYNKSFRRSFGISPNEWKALHAHQKAVQETHHERQECVLAAMLEMLKPYQRDSQLVL